MPLPRLAAIALLAALCLTGCGGNPSAKLIGKWKMTGISGMEANPLAAGFLKMMNISFEFKADGSCSANIEAMGQQKSNAGKWRFVKTEGNDLVVSLTMADTNKESEIRISFTDNDHCSFVPPAAVEKAGDAGTGKVEFEREKSS